MKKIGYGIVAFWFAVFRIFPVIKNQVFMIATHDDNPDGNIGTVMRALRKKEMFRIYLLTKKDSIRHPFHFFIGVPYRLARAEYVFLDNIYLPMAYCHFSRHTKVIQLWHGTGTVKKFGLDVNTGNLAKLEQKANRRVTHLIVNSDETKEQYSGAFGIDKENIYVLGLPRSDLYLDEKRMEEKAERFYQRFPELSGKRLILYAPTFRDEQVKNPELGMNLEVFLNGLHEDDVVMLRLHPYVAANFPEGSLKRYRGKIRNFSDYPEAAAVLAVSGLLITDYSSIIFEYCLLEKPIIFYAYDYEKFEKDGRSFYKDYTDYVPGEVVSTEKELLRAIGECETHSERVKDFKENSFRYLDGKSTKRLLHKILS